MTGAFQLSVRGHRGSGGSRTAPWANGFSSLQGPWAHRSQGETLRAASAFLPFTYPWFRWALGANPAGLGSWHWGGDWQSLWQDAPG